MSLSICNHRPLQVLVIMLLNASTNIPCLFTTRCPRTPLVSPQRVPMTSCREPRSVRDFVVRDGFRAETGTSATGLQRIRGEDPSIPRDADGPRRKLERTSGCSLRPSPSLSSIGLPPHPSLLPSCAYPPLLPPWFTRTYELLSL